MNAVGFGRRNDGSLFAQCRLEIKAKEVTWPFLCISCRLELEAIIEKWFNNPKQKGDLTDGI